MTEFPESASPVSVTAEAGPNHPPVTPELEDLNRGFEKALLVPLWTRIGDLMPEHQRSSAQPHRWEWHTLLDLAGRSGALVPVGRGGERRAIALANPGLGGRPYATPTLWAAIQYLMPGENAPEHRHTQNAFRVVVEGEGVWTVVERDPVPMRRGDFLPQAGMNWHAHHNSADQPMAWIDGLEGDALVDLGLSDVGAVLTSPGGLETAARTAGAHSSAAGAVFGPLVPRPGKVICVGLNYQKHIKEMGRDLPAYPTLFAKFADALIGAHDDIHPPAETEQFDWEGTALCRKAITDLDETSYGAASLLPGWTRRHVVAHLAGNAEALGNLVHWARTGEPTSMYSSPGQRAAGIAAGAELAADRLTAWFEQSAQALHDAMAALAGAQWRTEVVTVQGRTVPASDLPWLRSREVMVHAVDLDAGVSFTDLPEDFLIALRDDIRAKRGDSVSAVLGDPAEVAAYRAGRPFAGVTTVDGTAAEPLARWL